MLLLIDGGFGFEMETFELLNLLQARRQGLLGGLLLPAAVGLPLPPASPSPRPSALTPSPPLLPPPSPSPSPPQVHGFPKVMGVLTHLDGFRDSKGLKKTKKTLKHRFWTEIYQGAVEEGAGSCCRAAAAAA